MTTIRRVTPQKSADLSFRKFVSKCMFGKATLHAPVTSPVSRNKCHKPVSFMFNTLLTHTGRLVPSDSVMQCNTTLKSMCRAAV